MGASEFFKNQSFKMGDTKLERFLPKNQHTLDSGINVGVCLLIFEKF